MKKILLHIFINCIIITVYSQQFDTTTPKTSPFQLGQNVEGQIQNSINEVTGKVTFSVPITTIAARKVSYNLALTYNGQTAFDQGQNTNKYNPTSTIGVGFGMLMPKIVSNNKQTATKEDDTFYLQDGTNNTKLICIGKEEIDEVIDGLYNIKKWKFQTEKYVSYKVEYFEYGFHSGQKVPIDHWVVTNDQGISYYYGETSNSREKVVAWGNWIGSSNQTTGGKSETIVWNLSTIKDQWDNSLGFTYELREQTMGGAKQTEASYLTEINASTGEKIALRYGNKATSEFYEPHLEKISEPDAYQERYERLYLRDIKTYNASSELVNTYTLGHTVETIPAGDSKRYLTSIIQTNSANESLPSQEFIYHTSGTFQGGLEKIIYPMGGSVTYKYENKYLFRNSQNRFSSSINYENTPLISTVVKDNYVVQLLRSGIQNGGNYKYILRRFTWNGQRWDISDFLTPQFIKDNNSEQMVNFNSFFGKDYYGYTFYNEHNFKKIHLYLWHLNADGKTWDYHTETSINVGEGWPATMTGEDFVAFGTHHDGKIYTYRWDGSDWQKKTIYQGGGQYYYGATNNFILSLDEDGGPDMGSGTNYNDNFYIHYLDAERKWVSKSWSSKAQQHIASIKNASHFFPSNSTAGFVAENNPEFLLRWNKSYDLQTPDHVGWAADHNPFIPSSNSMLTLQNSFYGRPLTSARFNGNAWVKNLFLNYGGAYVKPAYGEDILTFQDIDNSNKVSYLIFNPNSNQWDFRANFSSGNGVNFTPHSGITHDFVIMNDEVHIRNQYSRLGIKETFPYKNGFTYVDGLSHGFIEKHWFGDGTFFRSDYLYINKKNNQLVNMSVGNKMHMSNRRPSKFGGHTPFMSPKSIWLQSKNADNNDLTDLHYYRMVDDKFDQNLYDIVVEEIEIDDAKGEIRKVKYTYNNYQCSPDNATTFYGSVTVENKGYGSASIGKVIKTYNNGQEDLQMAGVLLQEDIRDANNVLKQQKKYIWDKKRKNSSAQYAYSVVLKSQVEKLYLGSQIVENKTENTYSFTNHKLTKVLTTNSKGMSQQQDINYTPQNIQDKYNIIVPSTTSNRVDGKIVSYNQTTWRETTDGKAYPAETRTGTGPGNLLRLSNKITSLDAFGNVVEVSNGKGEYSVTLYGYDHKYPIAIISNARYSAVVNALDISISALQSRSNGVLKSELLKLYSRLPNAMISLSIYDNNGNILEKVNERKESMYYYYDDFNRLDYTTDYQNKVLEKRVYHFGSN